MRPRRFRRSRGARQARRWTAQLEDRTALVTGTALNVFLVTVADYASNSNLEPQGPTLERIRGFITIVPVSVVTASVWFSISVHDNDTSLLSINSQDVQNQIDENILYWGHYSQDVVSASFPASPRTFEVDVKAKRKLKDSLVILNFYGTGTAGTNFKVSANMRMLLTGNAAT